MHQGRLARDGNSAKTSAAPPTATIAKGETWRNREGVYALIQGTKPQSLAFGSNDSPPGLAAWIVEKFRAWSDCHGDVESD